MRRAGFWPRNAWKIGLGVAILGLLSARGASQILVHPHLALRSATATTVPCGSLGSGTTTWNTQGSPYILPVNVTNDPVANDPAACQTGIVVPSDGTLVIDATAGPVQIFSHGAAINVDGGALLTLGTSGTRPVTFDAEPDVAAWDGISITAADPGHRGHATLAYISIQHALTAFTVNSGALSTSDPSNPLNQVPYGLAIANSGIGPSYFDGIDATNTPISITGQADGRFGTVNNIGSQGVKVTFDSSGPSISTPALDVEKVTFGSSVPFAETTCPPLQACAAGSIGNDAILGNFTANQQQAVKLDHNSFFRAGSYGVELNGANLPVVTNNNFDCNGSGSAKPVVTCVGTGLKYSAIYLNGATADLEGSVTGNVGHEDGLDAIAFNGSVTSSPVFTWKNATNDPNSDHNLGYLVNGSLNLGATRFAVPGGSVVKVKGGAINITGGTLDASDPGPKVFTSLRDSVNIASCPSVFVQGCPSPLPPGEWGGVDLIGAGSNGAINNAKILYAGTGVKITNGATATIGSGSYGLTIAGSTIGPTFADGVYALDTPISVTDSTFACPAGVCAGPSSGDHGISADFTGSGPLAGGLRLGGQNVFAGSVNEAIKGIGLTGQTVDIEGTVIDRSGASGIQLVGADHLTLRHNTVTNSGAASPRFPAIYLNGVVNADFNGPIAGNTGSGNGLDAIAFHGTTAASLAWQTVSNSRTTGPLGYLVDGGLTIHGNFVLSPADYVPALGTITVKGGKLAANGAVLTSLRDSTVNIPTCGSIFDQKVSGVCPKPGPGDWGGLILDPAFANTLAGSEVRDAGTGITVGASTGPAITLALDHSNVRNTSGDGVAAQSPLTITGGAFTNLGGHGVQVDLGGMSSGSLAVAGAVIAATGQDGILARGLAGETVQLQGNTVDHAGTFGIDLVGSTNLALTNNTVTNSGAGFPAIYLNGFTGPFANVSGNRGAGNGLDALAFHGTVSDDLTWVTARKSGSIKPLGYLLDADLNLPGTLTVNAGDIVKIANGALNLGRIKADDTGSSSQKVVTSLADNSTGVRACPSALLPGCAGPVAGDWGGIQLAGNGVLVNAAIRYATTGISISGPAVSTFGSSSFGLVVSRSSIGPVKADAIDTTRTPISVTDSTITNAVHGINADFTSAASGAALRLSGNRFASTSAEAVLGQALGGHPVWITDNHVQAAGTFGLRLANADELVLRNNNISSSPAGYPAIYLSGVSADFSRDVRGNVGAGNGLDAIVMDGSATGNLSWISPRNQLSTHALGYLLDGGFTMKSGNLIVHPSDVVKALGGPITINGGSVSASGATFTSLKDGSGPAVSCPSAFVAVCVPSPGDWGGLVITADSAGHVGSGNIDTSSISYAGTSIAIDSGPVASGEAANFRLRVSGSTISNASNDGINTNDTPISVDSTAITAVGAHGIIASFFSPANCGASPAPCSRLSVTNSTITGTGKDGIIANGLAEQPVTISNNTLTSAGTYGIRLVGADQLQLLNNTVNLSGAPGSSLRYPAIYLSAVSGDFNTAITGNKGSGSGLDALIFHGIAVNGLSWLTAKSGAPALGYLLDGSLTVNGPFTSNVGDVVKSLNGKITINGAVQSSGSTFTSFKDDSVGMPACASVFVTVACGATGSPGDWGGITVNGGPTALTGAVIRDGSIGLSSNGIVSVIQSALNGITGDAVDLTNSNGSVFTDDTITSVGGSGVSLAGAYATFTRDVFTGIGGNGAGNFAIKTSGANGQAAIECTSIHGNAGGLASNGSTGSAIIQSDLYGNTPGMDALATVPTTATNDWWGMSPPAPTQYTPTVTVSTPLPQQPPTLTAGSGSIQLTDDNTNGNGNFGKGTLNVSLTFDREMNANVPLTIAFLGPLENQAHPITGSWNADHLTWTGRAPIDPLVDAAGLNTLTVSKGKSCVPDGSNLMADETATFTLDFGTATVVGTGGATQIGAASATLNDAVNPNGWSKASSNPKTDTVTFFLVRPDGSAYDPGILSGVQAGTIDPTTLPGSASIGHGTTAVPVSFKDHGLLPSTRYDYEVVALDLNGLTVGPEQSFTTTGPASQLVITGNPGSVAGDPYTFSVTAEDAGNRTVADYTGKVDFTSSDLKATVPPDYQFATTDLGVAGFTAVLKTAGSQSLTATDMVTGTITGGQTVMVSPAAAATLQMTGLSNGTAGVGQTATVTAYDLYSNVATGYTGTIHFSSGDTQAVLPSDYTFTPVDAGSHAFAVTLKTAGSQSVTVADKSVSGLTDQVPMTVAAGPLDHLVLSPATATVVAGGSQAYTAQGQDSFNNSLGDVTGATTFSISPDGSCTGTSCTATATGAHTVTGTDSGKTGTASLAVSAGPLDHLVLSPATATIVAGGSQAYTAQGQDSFNNSLGDVTGATTFSISPDGSCSGASCTATATGAHTVTGSDGGKTGTASLTVNAAPAPAVSGIAPTSGPAAGGTTVTVSGNHFSGATSVHFGSVAGNILSVTDTQITAKSPTYSAATVDVTVTTPGGTSTVSAPADQYSFVSYMSTVNADSPSVYWRLGESLGTTAADSSGHANLGTYSATGVTLGASGALVGDSDTAVTLDGASGAIQEVTGGGTPTGAGPRSVEVWLKTMTTTAQPLFDYGTAGGYGLFAVSITGTQIRVNDGTDSLVFTPATSLSDGAWHHLVVAYDGATSIAAYIDGAVAGASQTTTGVLATVLDGSGLKVGTDGGSGFFNGSLDEAAIYSSALTTTRVAIHYHAGHGDS